MGRMRPRHLEQSLVSTTLGARQQLMSQIYRPALVVRIFPGPPVTSPLVYARVRYELTGRRQWIVAHTLELPD